MAPLSVFSRGNAIAASRTRPSKPKAVAHASNILKNHAQSPTTSRGKPTLLTKYALTSKPHGIIKSKSRHPRSPDRRDREKRQRQLEHPLSGLFIETSESYRNTLITTAEAALQATRSRLLHRLNVINGPAKPHHDAARDAPTSPSDRLPTTAELQASHNAQLARMMMPFSSETITTATTTTTRRHGSGAGEDALALREDGADGVTLDTSMADFAAVVAREEERLRALGEEWDQVVAEIRLLGESIFGKGVVRGLMMAGGGNKADGARGGGVQGKGLGEEELKELRREVEEFAEEGLRRCEEVREEGKKKRTEQKKDLLVMFEKFFGEN